MRRLTILGLAFSGVATALLTASLFALADDATRLGRQRTRYRAAVRVPLARPVSDRPGVVFMGDSTIYGASAYPNHIAKVLRDTADVRAIRYPGFDFYHHYFSLGEVLELEPAVIVLVAHLRMFGRAGVFGMTDLVSMVPTAELPRAALLPLHERGITLPELIASRSLRYPWGERALELHIGLRAALQAAQGWRWLVPAEPQLDVDDPALRYAAFRRYDTPLYEQHPVVRMMAATIELARRRGAAVVVVVSPIPVARLASEGFYDPARFTARLEVLQRVTEARGGEFVDLHQLLPRDHFSDELGHTRRAGTLRIAEALAPRVIAALRRQHLESDSPAPGR